MSRRGVYLAALALLLAATGGCARGCTSSRPPIHLNPNMDHQPKATTQAASEFFADGKVMRAPVAGTVAIGEPIEPGVLETGRVGPGEDAAFATRSPLDIDEAVLLRGEERYGIYCAPCHADSGNGQSMLRQRAGVATADLLEARIRAMPDGQLFDVITHGVGLMAGYAYPIPPEDRWAIVAWVRELQAAAPVSDAGAEPAAALTAEAGAAERPVGETPVTEEQAEDDDGLGATPDSIPDGAAGDAR